MHQCYFKQMSVSPLSKVSLTLKCTNSLCVCNSHLWPKVDYVLLWRIWGQFDIEDQFQQKQNKKSEQLSFGLIPSLFCFSWYCFSTAHCFSLSSSFPFRRSPNKTWFTWLSRLHVEWVTWLAERSYTKTSPPGTACRCPWLGSKLSSLLPGGFQVIWFGI